MHLFPLFNLSVQSKVMPLEAANSLSLHELCFLVVHLSCRQLLYTPCTLLQVVQYQSVRSVECTVGYLCVIVMLPFISYLLIEEKQHSNRASYLNLQARDDVQHFQSHVHRIPGNHKCCGP